MNDLSKIIVRFECTREMLTDHFDLNDVSKVGRVPTALVDATTESRYLKSIYGLRIFFYSLSTFDEPLSKSKVT